MLFKITYIMLINRLTTTNRPKPLLFGYPPTAIFSSLFSFLPASEDALEPLDASASLISSELALSFSPLETEGFSTYSYSSD